MTPNEIRAELLRRGINLTMIADDEGCTVPQLSMCIGGSRIYPELREAIADRLKKPVGSIFGRHHPNPKRISGTLARRKAEHKAAA